MRQRVKCSRARCHVTLENLTRDTERGSALAWTALLLALVVLPLMMLTVDATRLFYLRNRLQTASDAACEDTAWQIANRTAFKETGTLVLRGDYLPVALGQATFHNVVSDAALLTYYPAIQISPNPGSLTVFCAATARVPGAMTPGTFSIQVATESAIRTR